jgi:O-antigen/teichoic acid export membrane protein
VTTEPEPEVVAAETGAGLPTEVGLTVSGMLLWGIANYTVYAVAARVLSAEDFSAYGVWWTAVNVLAVALFAPFESTGPHVVSATRLSHGQDQHAARWLVRTGAIVWLGTAAVFIVGCAVFPAAGALSWWSLAPLGLLNLAAAATASVQRGIAVGRRDYPSLFAQLATTGIVQTAVLLLLLVAGVHQVYALAAVTGLAPFVGVTVAAVRGVRPGRNALSLDTDERRAARHSLLSMSVSAMASQVMHNAAIPVANRSGLGPYEVGGYIGVVTLGRVPLMLLNPIGAPLIPRMTAAAAAGDQVEFRRILRLMHAVCAAVGLLGALVAGFLGQWLLGVYLGPGFTVPPVVMVSVALASALFLLNSFYRLALVSLDRPTASAASWIAALVVLFAILLSPLPIWWRLGLATPVSLSVLLILMGLSVRSAMRHRFAPAATG